MPDGRRRHGRRAAELLARHAEQHAETPARVREAAAARPRRRDPPGPARTEDAHRPARRRHRRVRRATTHVHLRRGGRARPRGCRSPVPELCDAMAVGDVMYLADGAIRLRVEAVAARRPGDRRRVEVGGAVASRQGLNVPGPLEQIASVPEEDLEHLAAGEKIGVDLVALSFVRSAQDIQLVREHTRLPLIAKIEKPQAVDRAEEIIRAADCVMVARGDLGIELPIEPVPIVQKNLLSLAGKLARPSITATQMLDSMVASSRPTRAEVADVANAILDGTDAVMLSQETAVGDYPVESVAMMAAIAECDRARRPTSAGTSAASTATPATRPTRWPTPPASPRASSTRRARHPDAVGPLGATRLRAPPDRADLRAVAGPRDRPPLRPMWGVRAASIRRHEVTEALINDCAPARRGARLAAAGTAHRHHGGAAERPARQHVAAADPAAVGVGGNVAPCSPLRHRFGSSVRAPPSTRCSPTSRAGPSSSTTSSTTRRPSASCAASARPRGCAQRAVARDGGSTRDREVTEADLIAETARGGRGGRRSWRLTYDSPSSRQRDAGPVSSSCSRARGSTARLASAANHLDASTVRRCCG